MKIVNAALLAHLRAAGPCELCLRICPLREPHHIRARGSGGGGRLDIRCNLIALGGSVLLPSGRRRFSCDCHRRVHAGVIPQARVIAAVAAREGIEPAELVVVVDLFRRLIKPSREEIRAALAELPDGARKLAARELRGAGFIFEESEFFA